MIKIACCCFLLALSSADAARNIKASRVSDTSSRVVNSVSTFLVPPPAVARPVRTPPHGTSSSFQSSDAEEVPLLDRGSTGELDPTELKARESFQFASMHTERNLGGRSATLYANYCRDLRSCFDSNFDKKVSSIRLWGIWLFYQDYNFGINGGSGSTLWVWGQNFKFNLRGEMDKAISSMRFVGASNDYFADSLTFFTDANTKGYEYFVYADFPTFPGFDYPIKSAVVTGSGPWTIFEDEFYGGRRVCLLPGTNMNPGFFTDPASLKLHMIRSARRGCDNNQSSEQALPDMIPVPNYFFAAPRLMENFTSDGIVA